MDKVNKLITVTFEFDVETGNVSKLKVFADGVEQKKKTTSKASTKKEITLEDRAIITLEPNKLVLNNRCVSDMKLVWEDRVAIKYEKFPGVKKPVPIIGKGESFDEPGTGNKLSKTNTVQFRGNANTILATYGTEFTLELYKEDLWKLVPVKEVSEPTIEKIEEKADELDVTILVDEIEDEEIELEEIQYKL